MVVQEVFFRERMSKMKYSREMIIEKYNSKEKLKYIFFWGHTQKGDEITKSCFSQWYPCSFVADGVTYNTAEQYMMAQKALLFQDEKVFEEIMEAKHPKQYQALGRKVRGFNQKLWDEKKGQIVIDGNYAKFSQNKPLKEFLLTTGDRVLVEASPYDKVWGIKLAQDTPNIENPTIWKGENLLGFALMEVREMLAGEEDGTKRN